MQNDNLSTEKSKRKKGPIRFLALIAFFLMLGFVLSFGFRLIIRLNPFTLARNLSIISKANEIEALLNNFYLEGVTKEDVTEGMYDGMLKSLGDPYSDYYTKEEFETFTNNTAGKYGGIGTVLTKNEDSGEIFVTEVFDDSPAKEAGITEGDIIVSADGNLGVSCELNEFANILRGEPGTKVSVVVRKSDGAETNVSLTRRVVNTRTVYFDMLDENTGYIQITEFKEKTAEEFEKAVESLISSGMENVIYDIRSNPGGLVNAVTSILDRILPKGVIVYTLDKNKNRKDVFSDDEHKLDIPCVVLIDKTSASSSEIFAGALKDYNCGPLLGTKTYGKGIIQNTYRLSDGSGIKITVAEYYTPKGNTIHKVGLSPDIELEYEFLGGENDAYDYKFDNQIQKALTLLD